MSDDELGKLYRWLIDNQGVDAGNPRMQAFKRSIDTGSEEIVERVKRIPQVKSLSGLYGN